ncbi:hypothetical protein HYZ97_04375 [Candidatus Pacearchaeota archaeon]|nr:hypothetical protein [Candidatus Pacearchaeota archaeon]
MKSKGLESLVGLANNSLLASSLFFGGQTIDYLTTILFASKLGIEYESNPLARYCMENQGIFLGILGLKLTSTLLTLGCSYTYNKKFLQKDRLNLFNLIALYPSSFFLYSASAANLGAALS